MPRLFVTGNARRPVIAARSRRIPMRLNAIELWPQQRSGDSSAQRLERHPGLLLAREADGSKVRLQPAEAALRAAADASESRSLAALDDPAALDSVSGVEVPCQNYCKPK